MINGPGKQAIKKTTPRKPFMRGCGGRKARDEGARQQIIELDGIEIYGRVVGVRGLMVEVAGPLHVMSVGARVIIEMQAQHIPCEVVGFTGDNALLMPFAAFPRPDQP